MIPDIENLISHSLCYDEMMFNVFDGGYACKDLSYLAENRTINIEVVSDDEGHLGPQQQIEQNPCEIIVVDVLDASECSDPNHVTYFSAQQFDGQRSYTNLTYLFERLKNYRECG